MVMAGTPAWRSSPAAWLVAASPTTGCPAVVAATAAACTVVVFPNPAGAIRLRIARAPSHSARTASAWSPPSPGASAGDGAFDHGRVEPGDRGGGEVVEMVEDPPFEEEVVPGGEQRGAPPGAVDEADGVVGVEERPGEVLDGVDVEAAGAEGGDPLDDLRLVEPGPVSTQPLLGVDEALDRVFPFQAGPQLGDDPVADLRFEGVAGRQSDLVRLGSATVPGAAPA